ncbi:MAG TPA: TlpA disulfide reductase family protein [Thiobacillaceae bacterium]|nr:TlpA disulfide reductase family protein [Thiobacillaceae bacterium]
MFNVWRRLFRLRALPTALLCLASLVQAADPPLQFTLTPVRPRLGAPELELASVEGQPVTLSGLKGKVVIVNFWATWCPPCRREFASMGRLRRALVDSPLEILAVNEGENVDVIEGFTSALDTPPSFPVLLDPIGDAMALWPVRGLPTTFVIDKRGRMAYRAIGGREFDHPQMLSKVKSLLREK